MRYGDDFILFEADSQKLDFYRLKSINFLRHQLKLEINPKSDIILKPKQGLKFLGIKFWPSGRTLTKRNLARVWNRLQPNNVASYSGLIKQHGNRKHKKSFSWLVYEKLFTS